MQLDMFVNPAQWKPSKNFPSLQGHKRIALDLETKDPNLKNKGPGVYRKDGHIAGIALAIPAINFKEYYPIGHEIGQNLPKEEVISWLKKEAADYTGQVVGANLMYDLDWLQSVGVVFKKARFIDVQYAEPLLDESALSYSLDTLAEKYLNRNKVRLVMEDAIIQGFGPRSKNDMGLYIWRLPPEYVVDYALGDVDLPLGIYNCQEQLLYEQELTDLFQLECALIPVLLAMRQRGVHVDVERAYQIKSELEQLEEDFQYKLNSLAEFSVNVDSTAHVAKAFDKFGYDYGHTAKGSPSFTKKFLEQHPSELAEYIREIRRCRKLRVTFIEHSIIQGNINGIIHGEFQPLRSGTEGTVSGRFSGGRPNLQQIPGRDKVWANRIRSAFIPEEDCQWLKLDWSQIEYRLIVHYAALMQCRGCEKAVLAYLNDYKTDFHQMVAEMTGLERRLAKDINFASAYNAGPAKVALMMGKDIEEAKIILNQYHKDAPFIREINNLVMQQAEKRGYIRTLLNRRRRFDRWQDSNNNIVPKDTPGAKRAFIHKALNALIQGSAADIMKKSIVDFYNSGAFDVLGAPHMLIHDEIDVSIPMTKQGEEAGRELHHIMENCVKLKVPLLCDAEIGPNWGQVETWE